MLDDCGKAEPLGAALPWQQCVHLQSFLGQCHWELHWLVRNPALSVCLSKVCSADMQRKTSSCCHAERSCRTMADCGLLPRQQCML